MCRRDDVNRDRRMSDNGFPFAWTALDGVRKVVWLEGKEGFATLRARGLMHPSRI